MIVDIPRSRDDHEWGKITVEFGNLIPTNAERRSRKDRGFKILHGINGRLGSLLFGVDGEKFMFVVLCKVGVEFCGLTDEY